MDTIQKIFDFLKPLPMWLKVLAIVIITAIAVLMTFSCSSLPKISDNKVGAEGVVQKEKNVNRQTKWYFKPDSTNAVSKSE